MQLTCGRAGEHPQSRTGRSRVIGSILGVYMISIHGIDSVGGAENCPGVTLDLGFKLLGQSAMTFPL